MSWDILVACTKKFINIFTKAPPGNAGSRCWHWKQMPPPPSFDLFKNLTFTDGCESTEKYRPKNAIERCPCTVLEGATALCKSFPHFLVCSVRFESGPSDHISYRLFFTFDFGRRTWWGCIHNICGSDVRGSQETFPVPRTLHLRTCEVVTTYIIIMWTVDFSSTIMFLLIEHGFKKVKPNSGIEIWKLAASANLC